MLAKAIINGNLVRKPQAAESGKYGFMTLAVQRSYKNADGNYDTDFVNIMISGEKLTDFYVEKFDKGDGVLVECEISTKLNKFDSEGKDKVITLVTRDFPSFATGRKARNTENKATTSPAEEFDTTADADDDLPF